MHSSLSDLENQDTITEMTDADETETLDQTGEES
jgi:hypothetical protein